MQPAGQEGLYADGLELSFDEVFRLLRRHWFLIIGSIVFSLSVASTYLVVTPAEYTATALLLIDPKTGALPSQQLRATDSNSESAYVETQTEVLRSERIAREVITSQELTKLPEFSTSESQIAKVIASVRQLFAKDNEKSLDASDPISGVIKQFRSRLDVKRNQSTYIIEISFRSPDPKLSAVIANAVVDAYIGLQLRQREESIRSTSQWLKQRVFELRGEATAAENALDQFRSAQSSGNAAGRAVLRDLESTAQTYRSISDSFQKRFLETSQSQTYSLLDARVVSEAWAPLDKSHPRNALVLAIATAIGLSIGFLIALARGVGERA